MWILIQGKDKSEKVLLMTQNNKTQAHTLLSSCTTVSDRELIERAFKKEAALIEATVQTSGMEFKHIPIDKTGIFKIPESENYTILNEDFKIIMFLSSLEVEGDLAKKVFLERIINYIFEKHEFLHVEDIIIEPTKNSSGDWTVEKGSAKIFKL